jgi:hypothetical protein
LEKTKKNPNYSARGCNMKDGLHSQANPAPFLREDTSSLGPQPYRVCGVLTSTDTWEGKEVLKLVSFMENLAL